MVIACGTFNVHYDDNTISEFNYNGSNQCTTTVVGGFPDNASIIMTCLSPDLSPPPP
jgi:hypothetical protein